MEEMNEKQTAAEQLKAEMDKWQTKLDEARVQLDLAAKDGRDMLQPHVDKLQKEWNEANEKLGGAAERFRRRMAGHSSWAQDIDEGYAAGVFEGGKAFRQGRIETQRRFRYEN